MITLKYRRAKDKKDLKLRKRIKFSPNLPYFFNLYLFDYDENMRLYFKKLHNIKNMPKYPCFVSREKSAKGNRLGEVFFAENTLKHNRILHELMHVMFNYLNKDGLGNKEKSPNFKNSIIFNKQHYLGNQEEHYCYVFEYIYIQVMNYLFDLEVNLKNTKKHYNDGLKFYNWKEI